MTSSYKPILGSNSKWDYKVQRYKSDPDLFSEKGLISILFLACGRPDVTKRSLLSTLDGLEGYDGEIELIFIENGDCKENQSFFDSIDIKRKVLIQQGNYGINQGLNQAWAVSRGEYCFIHENDWENRIPSFNFLQKSKDILDERSEIGLIHLRAIYDPNENWGVGKPEYSPWSCGSKERELAKVRLWSESTKNGYKFLIGDYPNGFNNNPIIMRTSLYRECGPYPEPELGTDPRHGETVYQGKVADTGCIIGHIAKELYFHCGQKSTGAI